MTRRQVAQSLVEFGLLLPPLLMLILGIVDAGRGAVASASLSNGAQEGARYGAIHWRDATWQADTYSTILNATLGLDSSQIQFPPSSVTLQSGVVNVQLVYTFQVATPLLSSIIGPLTLTAKASMAAQ